MTTEAPTNEALITIINKLAADHPGRYEARQNTPHKREAQVHYSYDDCFAGCVIREVDPDLHAELLAFEIETQNGFTLRRPTTADTRRLRDRVAMRFTPQQFDLLAAAQQDQDGGIEWSIIAEHFEDGLRA